MYKLRIHWFLWFVEFCKSAMCSSEMKVYNKQKHEISNINVEVIAIALPEKKG